MKGANKMNQREHIINIYAKAKTIASLIEDKQILSPRLYDSVREAVLDIAAELDIIAENADYAIVHPQNKHYAVYLPHGEHLPADEHTR